MERVARVPAEAGAVRFDMTKVRVLRVALAVAMFVIVAAIPLADRKLWPVPLFLAGMCALIGIPGALIRHVFFTRLVALCDSGIAISKRGAVSIVPWSEVREIRRDRYRGHKNFGILLRRPGPGLVFSPGALGDRGTHEALAFLTARTGLKIVETSAGMRVSG